MARKKSKSSSTTLSKDSVLIKTESDGCKLTGAYSQAIPRKTREELKSKDREVIVKKEMLPYLTPGSYEVLETGPTKESKQKSEEVPNKEDDSAPKDEDKS